MIVNGIVEWTKEYFGQFGPWGLFLLSFVESSFFPIPPDVLLIILILEAPSLWLWFAIICTVGSVLGAILGYYIGYFGGKPVALKLFKEEKINKVHKLFEKYEAWAIGIAGFTPIPYKVFTISAGLFFINFWKFLVASIISRGLRFLIVAGLVGYYGEPIIEFIDKYFGVLTILTVLVVFCIWYIHKRIKDKKNK